VPEWYFLPLYAILRSVTNKLLGVALIGLAILCIFLLPYFCKNFIIRSGSFRPIYAFIVCMFFVICLFLGWIGSLPVMVPYLEIGQFVTFFYFFIISVLFPFSGYFDRLCYLLFNIKKYNLKLNHNFEY
jgi:ubiquinol-cytochrome c reductase cytochrome b subunit